MIATKSQTKKIAEMEELKLIFERYRVTYLWSRVLEKLYSTLSLVKKFPAFYGT
jgi:hypothetical protein